MQRKTIAVITNDPVWTYNLRREILAALIEKEYRVVLVTANGKRIDDLKQMGCEFIEVPFERHGTNPFHEFKLFNTYYKILKELRPDFALTYTIKPNSYAGIVCGKLGIPYVANITGLGTAVEYKGPMQGFALMLYKAGLRNAQKVFFQNTENRDFMLAHKAVKGAYDLLPGSGVNTERFQVLPYPDNETIDFVYVGRVMKEKGIDQYLEAAAYIRDKYPQTRFHVCGLCEKNYQEILEKYHDAGTVIYHGQVQDVIEFHKNCQCTILPTYYPEGLNNALLESAASGRPIITTNRSGCREVIDDGVNGFIVKQQDSNDLIEKIEKFLSLSWEERRDMGLAGRAKVEKEFNRQIVVDKYMKEVELERKF